ncbi:UNVERIFIED_CONTAM: sterol carrier protein 2 [Siphonaria sp. JEL0065]|nr:sterol carrier protein 2 [Siphonaria sp. JEL0065]
MPNRTFVIGVGMTHFDKPGRKKDVDYPDYVLEAATKALLDANITYDAVEFAAVGYINADSTAGQRGLYQLGLTQIPIINVNNNCSTGSTALYTARNTVASGQTEVALALGFEKMNPGSLGTNFPDRVNPLDWALETMNDVRQIDPTAPFTPQIFCNAALEYGERSKNTSKDTDEAMHLIASKSHTQSTLNPYSQFNFKASVEDVKKARKVFGPMTLLHCSPTSDGAACCIVASEAFVVKHNLGPQAIEITGQVMATDSTLAFDPSGIKKSCLEIAGADMTRAAVKKLYKQTGTSPLDVSVCELHDCFFGNELITYDALGLCPSGHAVPYTLSGATFLPKFWTSQPPPAQYHRVPVNTSGGLISKGHPLGATGIAQCAELTWQLRGWCESRQVPNATKGLQHNVGLGGAVVVTLYSRPSKTDTKILGANKGWKDPRERVGYNPAASCRGISEADVRKVISKKGGLVGLPSGLKETVKEKLVKANIGGSAKL